MSAVIKEIEDKITRECSADTILQYIEDHPESLIEDPNFVASIVTFVIKSSGFRNYRERIQKYSTLLKRVLSPGDEQTTKNVQKECIVAIVGICVGLHSSKSF